MLESGSDSVSPLELREFGEVRVVEYVASVLEVASCELEDSPEELGTVPAELNDLLRDLDIVNEVSAVDWLTWVGVKDPIPAELLDPAEPIDTEEVGVDVVELPVLEIAVTELNPVPLETLRERVELDNGWLDDSHHGKAELLWCTEFDSDADFDPEERVEPPWAKDVEPA